MTGICFDILCKEKVGILVHLGGSNDLTTDWVVYKQTLIAQFWGAGSLRPGCQRGQVRVLFWITDILL